jgi:hypothetical protein
VRGRKEEKRREEKGKERKGKERKGKERKEVKSLTHIRGAQKPQVFFPRRKGLKSKGSQRISEPRDES